MARLELTNPMLGRVAIWTARSRGRHSVLHEGTPWSARMLGTVDARGPCQWEAAHHDRAFTTHPTREAALEAVSRRVFEELDLEVRTSSRVLFRRPGGIRDDVPAEVSEAEAETDAPSPRM